MHLPIDLPFYRMYPIFQLFRDSSILLLEAVLRVAVCPLFLSVIVFLISSISIAFSALILYVLGIFITNFIIPYFVNFVYSLIGV